MAGVEVIGRILGCSILHQSVGRISGTEELTRAELPALLSGLTEHELHYAIGKYGDDEASRIKFFDYLLGWIREKSKKEKWNRQDHLFLIRMTRTAIQESIYPNPCKNCKGRGFLSNKLCCKCSGSCRSKMSNRELANMLDLDESNIRRTWLQRYESVFQHLQTIDLKANKVVKNNSKNFLS